MMMMMMILDQISVCMAQNLPAVCMPQIDGGFLLVLWNCGEQPLQRWYDGCAVDSCCVPVAETHVDPTDRCNDQAMSWFRVCRSTMPLHCLDSWWTRVAPKSVFWKSYQNQ